MEYGFLSASYVSKFAQKGIVTVGGHLATKSFEIEESSPERTADTPSTPCYARSKASLTSNKTTYASNG